DFYFSRPDRITAGPPSQPYVDMRRREILERAFRKEILRRAFAHLADADDSLELGVNVHGQFGTVGDWDENRHEVQRWIDSHHDEVEQILDALLIGVEPDLLHQRDSLLTEAKETLVAQVGRTVIGIGPSRDLSQELAERGLLPMFGFPTRVRNLYHAPPRR